MIPWWWALVAFGLGGFVGMMTLALFAIVCGGE